MKYPVISELTYSSRSKTTAVDGARPVAEFGLSDNTQSLAWLKGNSKVMAVGMNQKNIKIVDLRGIVIFTTYSLKGN